MTAEADLAGKKVLVLEDDYFLASDASAALRSAGAEVVGPFPKERAALAAIEADDIHAAVVDINLGHGPSFQTAEALRAADVPFVFLTGYDQGMIPEDLCTVQRFEKPVDLKQVIRAIAQLA